MDKFCKIIGKEWFGEIYYKAKKDSWYWYWRNFVLMQQLGQSICQKWVLMCSEEIRGGPSHATIGTKHLPKISFEVLWRYYVFSFIFSLNSWLKIFGPSHAIIGTKYLPKMSFELL